MIAGMAHSILKSGAATRNGRRLRVIGLKVRVEATRLTTAVLSLSNPAADVADYVAIRCKWIKGQDSKR
jgi:hypothetical protein